MNGHALAENSLSAEQQKLARQIGTDGVLAVRLRKQLVEGRFSPGDGSIKLSVYAPDTLTDEKQIHRWADQFFKFAFRDQADDVKVDALPTKEGALIGVTLTGRAADRYKTMMRNLDDAELSLQKESPVLER